MKYFVLNFAIPGKAGTILFIAVFYDSQLSLRICFFLKTVSLKRFLLLKEVICS